MGVSGSGKTTIAKKLSDQLNIPYIEADDYHSENNKDKMKQGIPLNDTDRLPWLKKLHEVAVNHIKKDNSIVMACSALTKHYRDILTSEIKAEVVFVYLKGSYDLFLSRMQHRKDHFMPASLLKSQFDTLEEPQDALIVAADDTPEAIVSKILSLL